MDPTCPICADPGRYTVEQDYLEGNHRGTEYSRQAVERHMSHVADPRALSLVTDLANASSIAGRLRQLEVMAAKIMDAALSPPAILIDGKPFQPPPDAKVALQALREARATLDAISKLTATLESQHDPNEERPDLDDAISAYLSGKDIPATTQADENGKSGSQEASGPLAIEAPE